MALDTYGGYTTMPVPGGATGKFRVGKIGTRWVFATPSGNAFWMRAVYNTQISDQTDDMGSTYGIRVTAKYGDPNITWGPAQNRRLVARGFNAHAEYASDYVLPWTVNGSWPGDDTQPVKIPGVPYPLQAASYARRNINGYIAGGLGASIKNLYNSLEGSAAYLAAGGYVGRFPDVYDPGFQTWIEGRVASAEFATYGASPYLIGFSFDDTDYTTGFGAGHDFVPANSSYHPHLGFVVACTKPTQVSDTPEGTSVTFTNQTVFAKTAWRDFLIAKYGTIGALNTAWGTSSFYTTFNSTGTWGTGTGLLDEDGRHTTWLGTSFSALTGANANTKQDLDDFLYAIAAKYFTTYRTAIDAEFPGVMSLGPTNVGAFNAPARRQVLRAAGESLHLMRTSTDFSQAQTDFVAAHAGDLPLVVWMGAVANPDAAFFRYSNGLAADQFTTQAARGTFYADNVADLLARAVTGTGVKPYVGLQWWEFHDNWGEKLNWGLVSLSDNFYDGVEAKIAGSTDAWGYTRGGEEANYGNCLGSVTTANNSVESVLASDVLTSARHSLGAVAGAIA